MTELRPAPERLRAGLAPRSGMPEAAAVTAAVLRNLGRFAILTAEEAAYVAALGATRRRWRPGALLAADSGASGAHFVVSGWACRQRVLRDGRRQIFDFIVPGEGFGFEPLPLGPQSIVALTPLETVAAHGLMDGGPASADGLWRALQAARVETCARRQDHMLRLGQLTAYERASHFLLEMQWRVGAPDPRSFPLPLTQEAMADALGLSVVHLNRVLRQLRAAGLVEIRGGVAVVRDAVALAQAAVLPLPGKAAIAGC